MAVTASLPVWDLTPYFPSLESREFADALRTFKSNLDSAIESFDVQGIRKTDGSAVDGAVEKFESGLVKMNALSDESRLVAAYLHMHVDADSRNETAQSMKSALDADLVRLSQLRTRFAAWIGGLNTEELLANSQAARDHEYQLRKTFVLAQHQMSPDEEGLAADLSMSGSNAWGKLHGNLTSQIEVVVDLPDGAKTVPISMARNLAYNADPRVREAAYHAELDGWKTHETTLAATLNGVKGEVVVLSKRRGWKSPLESAIFGANIDLEALEAMLAAARESFPAFRRYLKAKARFLKLGDQLPFWSLFAPVGGGEQPWDWDRACDFIVEQFGSYSAKLANFADRTFKERWIDVETRPGKRDGAYCTGTLPGESRILMNYKSSFGSVSTLAHELGHAYHNLCLKDRTPTQTITPMTLAETASIFCETIIRHKGLESGTDAEKLNILEAAICGYCQVVVDITSRYEFESSVLALRDSRECAPSELCEFMLEAQRNTYGDGLDPNVLHGYMWAAKPHYYSVRSYYNFPYMFGLLFGIGLFAQYRMDPDAFRGQYDELLSSTGLADAATLAGRFGFDIRSIDFWRSSLKVIQGEIDQFVTLTG